MRYRRWGIFFKTEANGGWTMGAANLPQACGAHHLGMSALAKVLTPIGEAVEAARARGEALVEGGVGMFGLSPGWWFFGADERGDGLGLRGIRSANPTEITLLEAGGYDDGEGEIYELLKAYEDVVRPFVFAIDERIRLTDGPLYNHFGEVAQAGEILIVDHYGGDGLVVRDPEGDSFFWPPAGWVEREAGGEGDGSA